MRRQTRLGRFTSRIGQIMSRFQEESSIFFALRESIINPLHPHCNTNSGMNHERHKTRFGSVCTLIGCPSPQVQNSLKASDISYNDQNVALHLNLESQLMVVPVRNRGMSRKIWSPKWLNSKRCRHFTRRTRPRTYASRASPRSGIAHAKLIPFDPRVTTLQAQTLQETVDEIMARISVLESSVLDNLRTWTRSFRDSKGQKGQERP